MYYATFFHHVEIINTCSKLIETVTTKTISNVKIGGVVNLCRSVYFMFVLGDQSTDTYLLSSGLVVSRTNNAVTIMLSRTITLLIISKK